MSSAPKLLLAFALLIAALAGCGGDDNSTGDEAAKAANGSGGANTTTSGDTGEASDDTGETSSLTKAQFIKAAEEICARNTEDFLTPLYTYIGREEDSGKGEAELAAEAVQKVIVPKFQALVDEISELDLPAGDEAEVEEFLAATQQGIDSLNEKTQLSLATDVDAAFQRSRKLAAAYGMLCF